MPIVDIQRRFRELGRIRTGHKVTTKRGKKAPAKLARFRLTSPWEHLIEQAADVFGGTAQPWENEGTRSQEWEVYVEVDSLPVVVPPGEVFDQWYELWTGGGCSRRCDGVRQVLVDRPCQCPADPMARQDLAARGEACKPTTRVRLMLPDVADVGIWRLESHGFHAAAELGGAAGLVEAATRAGAMIPADLRLAKREGARRPGEPRKDFYVPALSFRGTLGPVLDALGILDAGSSMPALLGHVEPRPPIDAGGSPGLPSGTPFDPSPVDPASFPPALEAPAPTPTDEVEDPGPVASPPEAFDVTAQDDPGSLDVAPEPFDPPAHVPTDEGSGPTLTGPQVIAVRLKDLGVLDRDEKLRAVCLLVGREVSSSKDLRPAEVRTVLETLGNPDDARTFLEWHREEEAKRGAEPPEPAQTAQDAPGAPRGTADGGEDPVIVPEVVSPSSGPRRRRPADTPNPDDPRAWGETEWRNALRAHGLKPVALLRQAATLGQTTGRPAPTTLAQIAGSGFEDDLAGWVYASKAET